MKIKFIDHIRVAVKNLSEASKFYTDILGLERTGTETVSDQKARVSFIPIKDTNIELLESTEPGGPIAKFIESRGEGIHHIALRVENIEEAVQALKTKGVRLIDQKPRIGARGIKIAFIHPRETKGVLIEICEENRVQEATRS
jgi:methylmalonyl-CoA/ethylmalonyl-CoA epimerase